MQNSANSDSAAEQPPLQPVALYVRDVMKSVPVRPSNAPVAEAAQVMMEEGVNLVPVGTADDIQGVVTVRDIALTAGMQQTNPTKMPVDEIIQNLMSFCHEGETLGKALKAMLSCKTPRLLVRDANGAVVGVVTMEDIFQAQPNLRDEVAA